jgi:uncharacterized LabA/DUF88 family protein
MDKCVAFVDAGFLSKVSYHLGEGHYFKYDLLKFSKLLAGKEGLVFKHLFYYNAPPFQGTPPTKEQRKRKMEYDSFVGRLKKTGEVTVREGRCQRLKRDGQHYFKQKGVDTLLTMDLMEVPIEYAKIRKVVLIASDSDFVPVIEKLKKRGIEVVLYTYFDRNRKSKFSTSNDLLNAVTRYVQLKKFDFEESKL